MPSNQQRISYFITQKQIATVSSNLMRVWQCIVILCTIQVHSFTYSLTYLILHIQPLSKLKS